ncbi:FecR family protein [Algihabitans sp.]|uniref:FecR family protein n=1 Tax=Algihabitans sp. TaxID=2821514 RepID=UPI003BAAC3FB
MKDHGQHLGGEDETVAAARDWLVRMTSGEPTAEESRRFQAWLAQSPSHRKAYEQERLFWQRLGHLKAASGPHTWAPASRASAPSTERSARGRVSARARRTFAAAGLAAACLSLFLLSGDWLRAAVLADHRTAQGELLSVDLSDGSTTHLDTDTALAVTFNAAERRIALLRGEALFEVAPDPQRPFRVELAGGVIEAVGTAFVVRHDGDAADIAVLEGQVRVVSPAAAGSEAAAILARPGERTRFAKDDPPSPPETFDLRRAAAWRQGVILIDGLPLDRALEELDRYRPGRILLMGEGDDYRPVSGAFDLRNVDAAVAGLAATHGLSVTAVTDYLLILH